MNKKIVSLVAIMASLTAICVSPLKGETLNANSDDKVINLLSRAGMGEGVIRSETTYTGLNIKWKATTAYTGLHVRVIGAVIPDEGKDYADLSAYTRLEYEVREGVTKEYFAPTYIDSDGTYAIVGTDDGNVTVAGTKIDCNGSLSYPTNGGANVNYSGSPVWMAEGKDDFANYHFKMKSDKCPAIKTYADWSSTLSLPNRDSVADQSKVKCFALNLYKSENNRNYNWDFDVLKVYGRDANGNRKLIFDASKAVVANSMNDVWENMKDANGNSYVYAYTKNLGTHASDVSINIEEKTKLTSDETKVATKWTINKFAGGYVWGWSKLAEAARGAVVDCSGYDAAVYEVNNTTGQGLYLKPRYSYVDANGATQNAEMNQQYTLVSEDGNISLSNNYTIPAGFKGKVYTFLNQYTNNFIDNLSTVKNDFRMVIGIDDNNNRKSFELTNYRFTKTGLDQYKQDVYNSLDVQRAKYDDSNYSTNGVAKLNEVLSNAKQEVKDSTDSESVRSLYNKGVESLNKVPTKVGEIQIGVNQVESHMNLAYRYTAADNTSEFRLQIGVDASIVEMAASYGATWGIEVTSGSKTQKFDTVTKEDGEIKYVVIGLGDVLNNLDRATAVFSARAYMVVGETTYYSEAVKSYSVAQMIAEYKTLGKPVDGMYQAFVDAGLYQ